MPPRITPPKSKIRFGLTSRAKRIAIAITVGLLLFVTLSGGRSQSWWDSYLLSRPVVVQPPDGLDGFQTPLNISQWGERGNRVKKLATWADLLTKNPHAETNSFQDALVAQFPFLNGTQDSLYTPWSPSRHAVFSSKVGFVVCAGSRNFHLAAHLIRNLRRVHGSQTPIEIAYAGDDDLEPKHRSFLSNLESNISFINLLERFPAAHDDLVGSGWATKPFALLASSHSRAILMDADALFLTSPDSLFEEHPALSRTGTLFFHDRAAVGSDNERLLWVQGQIKAAGISPSHYLATESLFYSGAAWYEADSGVVAVDKSIPSVILGLIFATWMNTKEVREQVSYQIFYGDKETFWVAMELSSAQYSFQPWYAGSMGTISLAEEQSPDLDLATNEVEICGTHMLHLDHRGQTPFWINGGVYEHKDNMEAGFAKMTHYWVGDTADIRLTQPTWYWVNGNVGCLKEKGVKAIPESIMENIKKIQEEARRVDQMVRHL